MYSEEDIRYNYEENTPPTRDPMDIDPNSKKERRKLVNISPDALAGFWLIAIFQFCLAMVVTSCFSFFIRENSASGNSLDLGESYSHQTVIFSSLITLFCFFFKYYFVHANIIRKIGEDNSCLIMLRPMAFVSVLLLLLGINYAASNLFFLFFNCLRRVLDPLLSLTFVNVLLLSAKNCMYASWNMSAKKWKTLHNNSKFCRFLVKLVYLLITTAIVFNIVVFTIEAEKYVNFIEQAQPNMHNTTLDSILTTGE
ncbi:hypothetical protein NEFER03_0967 [Nematocida sp. LUAm3]|nr:hypothetical protein NEFER03_0804 [Nematocida sp. LUAm3]KAI5171662.1 hypothetical protein NEFER03_0967 [Nematocida sp. LUAm3]KAI5175429.1 hypothetical protein NEFER02_1358 [Nematocida sp. LUAm2]KAI5177614.1 hypothetical protein NEFER01_0838 [Nematocida sp. LUAm1]